MVSAAWMAISTARRFRTGKAPGWPRHTGQTLVLGGAPNPVRQPQKILVRVFSWTCTSSPITGSYFAISSGVATPKTPEAMLHYRKTSLRRKAPVAYARGSEPCYRTATVRESVPLPILANVAAKARKDFGSGLCQVNPEICCIRCDVVV